VKQVTFAGPPRCVDNNYANVSSPGSWRFFISVDLVLHWALKLKRNMQAVRYRQRKHHSGPVATAGAAAAGAGGAAVSLYSQMSQTTPFALSKP